MKIPSKTITVQSTDKLIGLFVQDFVYEETRDLSLRPLAVVGGAEIRLEALGEKLTLEVRPLLHISRKLLKSGATMAAADLLLAPHIPDELAADFRRQAINHADLNGRLFIKTPRLLFDRTPRVRRYCSPVTTLDLFSLKTSRLVRCLLAQRDRAWTQEELTARTGLSRGLVSRALGHLVDEDYVSRESRATREAPALYRLREFDRLLDAWRVADRWARRVEVREYSVLTGGVNELAANVRELLRDKKGNVAGAFTQWFAARLRQPYTDSPVVSVYVRKPTELALPFARPVTSGGNLWLIVPADEGVFQETQEVDGFPLVADVQIYLDLMQVEQRGPEQAEALQKWEGFAR